METLKELRVKYKQLKKEGDDIYNKIRILEKKEILSNFVVGNCYFDINFNTLIKISSFCLITLSNLITSNSFF